MPKPTAIVRLCAAVLVLVAGAGAWAQDGGDPPVFVELPQIISNLDTDGRGQRFILLNLSVEVAQTEHGTAVRHEMPRIQDLLQAYLRDLTVDDLAGSAGTYALREAVLHRIRLAVAPIPVQRVLFRAVLIQ